MVKTKGGSIEYVKGAVEEITAAFAKGATSAKKYLRANTPVKTRYAQRSTFANVSVKGKVVEGDTADDHGNAAPTANKGEVGMAFGGLAPYYRYINDGTRGRSGTHAVEQARDIARDVIKRELSSVKGR